MKISGIILVINDSVGERNNFFLLPSSLLSWSLTKNRVTRAQHKTYLVKMVCDIGALPGRRPRAVTLPKCLYSRLNKE